MDAKTETTTSGLTLTERFVAEKLGNVDGRLRFMEEQYREHVSALIGDVKTLRDALQASLAINGKLERRVESLEERLRDHIASPVAG